MQVQKINNTPNFQGHGAKTLGDVMNRLYRETCNAGYFPEYGDVIQLTSKMANGVEVSATAHFSGGQFPPPRPHGQLPHAHFPRPEAFGSLPHRVPVGFSPSHISSSRLFICLCGFVRTVAALSLPVRTDQLFAHSLPWKATKYYQYSL